MTGGPEAVKGGELVDVVAAYLMAEIGAGDDLSRANAEAAIEVLVDIGALVPSYRRDEQCHSCEQRIGDHRIDGRCPGPRVDRPLVVNLEVEKLAGLVGSVIFRSIEAHTDEFINEVLARTPESWGDDVAAEAIAIGYVRHLEAEVERLGGCLERWCRWSDDGDDEPCTHGYLPEPRLATDPVERCGVCSKVLPLTGPAGVDVEVGGLCSSCAEAAAS